MNILKSILEDLTNISVILSKDTISDADKVKEVGDAVNILFDRITPVLSEQEKQEQYEDAAYDILTERHYNIAVISQEYQDGNVSFEFYVASHDYSAGRDCDTITEAEIKRYIRMRKIDSL